MKHNAPSHRQERVAILINNALINALRRGKMVDERLINCPITITRIKVSGDLKTADCYFLPFNLKPLDAETAKTLEAKEKDLLDALNKSKYAIRHFVTEEINLKYSPELRFHYDHSFDNAYKVEELLKRL